MSYCPDCKQDIRIGGPAHTCPESRQRKALGPSDATACSPSYYTFRNREGQTIQLRGDLTMEDLVRMGYTDIRLAKPETPLKPNEWRADSIPENVKVHTPLPTTSDETEVKP